MSREASLLADLRTADLELQIRLGHGSGRPFLIQRLEQDALDSLISVPQQVAVGTGQGLGLVALPELPDVEVPSQLGGIHRGVGIKGPREKALRPAKLGRVGRGVNEVEPMKSPEKLFVISDVREIPKQAG